MKLLCLILFVAASSQGFVLDSHRIKRSSDLRAPNLLALVASDPADVDVTWSEVKSDDESDPVLGYKLKYWELPDVQTYNYETINGVKTLVAKNDSPKFTDEIPKAPPKEIITKATTQHIDNLKFNIMYEFRVQAYSKNRESALSAPMGIKLHKDESAKDLYQTV